jgi:hypothetical protein
MYFCVVLCIVCFATYFVLFVCICVLNYCHLVAIQLQLNKSYHNLWQMFIPYITLNQTGIVQSQGHI